MDSTPQKVKKLKVSKRLQKRLDKVYVKRLIDKQIKRNIERQEGQDRTTDTLIGTMQSTPFATNDQIWCITPNSAGNKGISILQGNGTADRKGNKILLTKSQITITAIMEAYNATYNPTPRPQVVKWFVITAKKGINFSTAGDVALIRNDLYQSGNNTQPASGNIYDLMDPINKDKYEIHKSGQFKLFWAEYTGTGGAGATNGNNTNNDFKYYAFKKLNFTKYCPKYITYIDNSPVPSSKPVWFVMYTVRADGGTASITETPIRVRVIQNIEFKDV